MKLKFPWFKKANNHDIVDILEQFKSELSNKHLIIKKELHLMTKYFNNIPIIYAIVSKDGLLIRYNKAFKKITCVSDDCVGNDISMFMHPDDKKAFKKFIPNLQTDKIITRVISRKGDLAYVKWGGVYLEDEQMHLLFGQDVTHEMELNEQIQDFIQGKNLLLDNYPRALVSTNLNGIITEFNKMAEKDSGYTAKNLINKHIFDIIPCKDLFDETRFESITKIEMKKKSGEIVNRFLLFLPLLDDSSNMVGYFGIWHDENYLEYIKSVNN